MVDGYVIKPDQPIIFLDIDGVLNSKKHFMERGEYSGPIGNRAAWYMHDLCDQNIKVFNQIVDETGAYIVISSSWRYGRGDLVNHVLFAKGVRGEIVGHTPSSKCWECVRGNEIDRWIKEHWSSATPEGYVSYRSFDRYVILDDDSDMLLYQKDNFVQTSWETGITGEQAIKAIQILKSFCGGE